MQGGFFYHVLSERTTNLFVMRCWSTATTTLKKFSWSQRSGSAEQFKEGGTHGQSWPPKAQHITLGLCMPATCQEHTTPSIKMSKWGNWSSSVLQGLLTTANRSCRGISVVQSQPVRVRKFALSSMTPCLDAYHASYCQCKAWPDTSTSHHDTVVVQPWPAFESEV